MPPLISHAKENYKKSISFNGGRYTANLRNERDKAITRKLDGKFIRMQYVQFKFTIDQNTNKALQNDSESSKNRKPQNQRENYCEQQRKGLNSSGTRLQIFPVNICGILRSRPG